MVRELPQCLYTADILDDALNRLMPPRFVPCKSNNKLGERLREDRLSGNIT
jgi:hypothetical protein